MIYLVFLYCQKTKTNEKFPMYYWIWKVRFDGEDGDHGYVCG